MDTSRPLSELVQIVASCFEEDAALNARKIVCQWQNRVKVELPYFTDLVNALEILFLETSFIDGIKYYLTTSKESTMSSADIKNNIRHAVYQPLAQTVIKSQQDELALSAICILWSISEYFEDTSQYPQYIILAGIRMPTEYTIISGRFNGFTIFVKCSVQQRQRLLDSSSTDSSWDTQKNPPTNVVICNNWTRGQGAVGKYNRAIGRTVTKILALQ